MTTRRTPHTHRQAHPSHPPPGAPLCQLRHWQRRHALERRRGSAARPARLPPRALRRPADVTRGMPHRPRTPVSPTAGRPATRTSEPCLGQIVAYNMCVTESSHIYTQYIQIVGPQSIPELQRLATSQLATMWKAAAQRLRPTRPPALIRPASAGVCSGRPPASASLGPPRPASASTGNCVLAGRPLPAMLPTQVRQAAGHRGPPRLLRLRRATAALPPRTGSLPHADEAGGRAAIAHCGMARHRGLHPNPNLNPNTNLNLNPSPSPNPDPNPNR